MKGFKFVEIFGIVGILLLASIEVSFGNGYNGYPYNETACYTSPKVDAYQFYQNHCTSYAAYMLNKCGVPFKNGYLMTNGVLAWGNAGNWDNAAGSVARESIHVDRVPLPGDVAYWELNWTGDPKNTGDDYGHVAWVERVIFDENEGDDENITPVSIEITEYNFEEHCGFSRRTIPISEPSGFIHILAYNEGVTSLFYMDNYEMSSLSSINQTEKEWKWILEKVNDYRCKTCSGNYRYVADVFYTDYGMGGGDAGDDGTSLNGPDGNIKEVKVSLDGVNYVRSLQVKPGQKLQGRVKVTNKGDETIDYFEVFLRRSNDQAFTQDDYSYGREEEGEDLKPGESKNKHRTIIAPSTAGKYYLFGHLTRVDGKSGGKDQDGSNNISRSNDADEYAVIEVLNPGATPVNKDMNWLPAINYLLSQ